ncbi:MAG TPA: FecR family protein, partial [Chthoniobacter sp.]|nr:FecR family protein [Chthoniobacter sp.]
MLAIKHVTLGCFALFAMGTGAALAADERSWQISKMSGDAWTVSSGVQSASLSSDTELRAGQTLRTGRNGRVLLRRGEESILIAPNSAITIPSQASEGLTTTIVQQAGSILLEVEKRNVKHFEVETPYLAAVVKGTQFRVSVDASGTKVSVLRGQVQVSDFKSGQIAQVMPGQGVSTFAEGKPGLTFSGTGTFSPIEQGKPRPAATDRLPVPKTGLTAPRNAASTTTVRALANASAAGARSAASLTATRISATTPSVAKPAGALAPKAGEASSKTRSQSAANANKSANRISAPIGEVRLNFSRVTNGLARDGSATPSPGRRTASNGTIWSSDGKPSNAGGSSQGGRSESGSPSTLSPSASSVAAAAAAPAGPQPSANIDQTPSNSGAAPFRPGNSGANGNGYGTRVG